jgi:squalene-associated FAD-dependent desaturase
MRIGITGGGWAGLAAAVGAVRAGHDVTLFEAARTWGGRARSLTATLADGTPTTLDNGQHILIGAYRQTLGLMRTVGVDVDVCLRRSPLELVRPDGSGLRLKAGAAMPAFAAAVWRQTQWSWRDRLSLLTHCTGWLIGGFRCDPRLTVAQLTARLPQRVTTELIEPLCVAALNTDASQASAQVFLRVLKDALGGGAGSADLLLPTVDLSALMPLAAEGWLKSRGAEIRLSARVSELTLNDQGGWCVDGQAFDAVVLAVTSVEAARLTRPHHAAWAAQADALLHEPIATVYARSTGARLPLPMLALDAGPDAPAQFVFDRGALSSNTGWPSDERQRGLLAFVISGAAPWVAKGADATITATLEQARRQMGSLLGPSIEAVRLLVDKRATFACVPGLQRPPSVIAKGLWAAADYIDGPYPATLEGAVRSGLAAGTLATASAAETVPPAVPPRTRPAAATPRSSSTPPGP